MLARVAQNAPLGKAGAWDWRGWYGGGEVGGLRLVVLQKTTAMAGATDDARQGPKSSSCSGSQGAAGQGPKSSGNSDSQGAAGQGPKSSGYCDRQEAATASTLPAAKCGCRCVVTCGCEAAAWRCCRRCRDPARGRMAVA
eukprot:365761-Chlamydomonas_euryale.AAC.2